VTTAAGGATYLQAINQQNERLYVDALIRLASNKETDGSVKAVAHNALTTMSQRLTTAPKSSQSAYLRWAIGRYLDDPDQISTPATMSPPDGAPIDPGQEWLDPACDVH
jgi:hypothetical protein